MRETAHIRRVANGVACHLLEPLRQGAQHEHSTIRRHAGSGGKVCHFCGAELGGTQDPGQDPRGAPDPAPLWNLLDLTPGERGEDWYPKLSY
ncbi:putative uncharacterized protein [Janthinobacterium agaricidamnosum NBRC 102515 = DSM 9628]|uniref:Uncharacterized protein n=1 Tax=Janthinobacterium agaricidamnosum NBRC 102515 = DSM 9628 TaxID=1349767 RepID=W0V0N0_9BURK|nr:putative uncharacterized protein [Janthinobacterium agaricidamnosum NBRC 102515 = DSM 9628]